MRGITLYSKNAGVEVKGNDVVKKGYKFGVVTLRFFKLESGTPQVRFVMTPVESYNIHLQIKAVLNSAVAIKKSLAHKFEKEGQEIVTTLTLEKWEREGKSGFAISIKRGDTINVPMDATTFAYIGELLRYLSTQQAWVNPVEDEDIAVETALNETADDEVGLAAGDCDFEDEDEEVVEHPPTPVEKPGNALIATIDAVRKDGKAIKVGGQWYTITDRSKVNMEIEKNKKIKLYFSMNGGRAFANAIYPAPVEK